MDSVIDDIVTDAIVTKEQVSGIWNQIEDLIREVIEEHQDEQTLYDVAVGLHTGNYILWVGMLNGKIESISIYNIINYPSKKVLNVMIFNANNGLLRYKDVQVQASYNLAVQYGCNSIYLHGRCGMQKVLKDDGYKEIYRVTERKIK